MEGFFKSEGTPIEVHRSGSPLGETSPSVSQAFGATIVGDSGIIKHGIQMRSYKLMSVEANGLDSGSLSGRKVGVKGGQVGLRRNKDENRKRRI